MLYEFLSVNRTDLIDRCMAKVLLRPARQRTGSVMLHGIPEFLDQLIKTLKIEQSERPMQSRQVSGPEGGANPAQSELSEAGQARQVKVAIKAVAFGSVAATLVKQAIGSSWKFTGFLATPRNGKHPVLHIQSFDQA